MDFNQIIRIARMLGLQRYLHKGIDAGVKKMASRGKAPEDMTPEEHQTAKQAQGMAKRAQKMARMGRRIGRM
jgi:hypothetical protein